MDPVTVTTASGPFEADVIKGLLESAGIPVMLRSTNIGFERLGSVATGPVDVVVPAGQVVEARQLLAEAENHSAET